MTENESPPEEVSVDGRLTATSVSARVRSRAFASFDRLLGATVDIAAAKMEGWAGRIRDRRRLDAAISDAVVGRVAEFVGSQEDAARLVDGMVGSRLQALANKMHVVERAVEHLASPNPNSQTEPEFEEAEVDPDWLNHFGGYSEKASSDKVRDLWGSVLAGEIRRPSSFSLSTLRLLAELDKTMASWFEEEVALRVQGEFILPPVKMEGNKAERLTFLEEVGLIRNVVPSSNPNITFNPNELGYDVIIDGDLCLRMRLKAPVNLGLIPLTRSGREICQILPPVDTRAALLQVGAALRDRVISVELCKIDSWERGGIVTSPIEVLKAAQDEASSSSIEG